MTLYQLRRLRIIQLRWVDSHVAPLTVHGNEWRLCRREGVWEKGSRAPVILNLTLFGGG